jgi:hypothetical protein
MQELTRDAVALAVRSGRHGGPECDRLSEKNESDLVAELLRVI